MPLDNRLSMAIPAGPICIAATTVTAQAQWAERSGRAGVNEEGVNLRTAMPLAASTNLIARTGSSVTKRNDSAGRSTETTTLIDDDDQLAFGDVVVAGELSP